MGRDRLQLLCLVNIDDCKKHARDIYFILFNISGGLEGTEPAPPPWATDRGRDDRPTPDK